MLSNFHSILLYKYQQCHSSPYNVSTNNDIGSPYNGRSHILLSHTDSDVLLHGSVNSVHPETSQQHQLLEVTQLITISHGEWQEFWSIGVEPLMPFFLLKQTDIKWINNSVDLEMGLHNNTYGGLLDLVNVSS